MSSSPSLGARRRTTLGALLGAGLLGSAAALGGCDLDLPGRDRDGGGAPDSAPPPERPEDDDIDLAGEAIAATSAALALIDATIVRHPGLGDALAAFQALHGAHLAVLADAGGPSTAPEIPEATPPVRARSERALREVRRRENRTQRTLADLALRARSGGFARLLASMSAGVGQHVIALPAPREGAA